MPNDVTHEGALARPEPPGTKTDTLEPPAGLLDLPDSPLPAETREAMRERLSPTERIVLDELVER